MWDLTVPGNNDHDFYVERVAFSGLVGNTSAAIPVLVHNCDEADEDLLNYADDVMQKTSSGPGGCPATASKITTADGQVRFATSGDTRTGLLPPRTASAIADAGGHGGCAEINCAAVAESEGFDLQGSTVQTVKIGGGGWKNGAPMWGYEEHGDLIGPFVLPGFPKYQWK